MEILPNGMTLQIPGGCFPLSTDSMVLSHFVRLTRNARVLDLGSGCGTLGLLLCADHPGCSVIGIEQDPAAHEAALENIHRNALTSRMESLCGDLRSVSERFAPGSFSCVVSNPPYFTGGAQSLRTPLARREDSCSAAELLRAAAWAVKYGGDVFLVHRPERLGELMGLAWENGLQAKRLCLVHHREDGPVSLILLQLRKGAKPGLEIRDWALHHGDGTETELFRRIYHV